MSNPRLEPREDNNIVAADVVDGVLILRRFDGSIERVTGTGSGFDPAPVVYSLELGLTDVPTEDPMTALDLTAASSFDLANENLETVFDLETVPGWLGDLNISHSGSWFIELGASGLWQVSYTFASSAVTGLNQFRIGTSGTWLANGVYGEAQASEDGYVGVGTLTIPVVSDDSLPGLVVYMKQNSGDDADLSCTIYMAKIM